MPPVCRVRPAIGPPASGPVPAPAPAPMAPPNDLIQEFMRTYIKKIRDQAPTALVTLAAKARDDTNRLLNLRNPDLYYCNLYMEYYYFCQ